MESAGRGFHQRRRQLSDRLEFECTIEAGLQAGRLATDTASFTTAHTRFTAH